MFRNPEGDCFKRISEGVAVYGNTALERCRVENPREAKTLYYYFKFGPKSAPLTGYRTVTIDDVTHVYKTRLGNIDDFNIHSRHSLRGLEYDILPYIRNLMMPVTHHPKCNVVSKLENGEHGLTLNMLIIEWSNYFEIKWRVSKIMSMLDKAVSNPNLAIDVSDDIEIESYYPELCSTEKQRNAVIKIVLDFMYQDKFKEVIIDTYNKSVIKPGESIVITDIMLTPEEELAQADRNIKLAKLAAAHDNNDPECKKLMEQFCKK